MPHAIEERLSNLGITLPHAPAPAANYLPYILSGNQLLIAGQAAMVDGKHPFVGRLGAELSVVDGKAAARLAAINVLAQVKAACFGDCPQEQRRNGETLAGGICRCEGAVCGDGAGGVTRPRRKRQKPRARAQSKRRENLRL